MSRPLVYLAGQITGASFDDAAGWRQYAKKWLDDRKIDALSPLRAKHWLESERSIDGAVTAYNNSHPLSRPKGICARDRFDVMRCDVVLMNLLGMTRVSIGSMIELGWADAFRRPVVMVIEDHEQTTNPQHHAMVHELTAFTHHTLTDALATVEALLRP